ncbi:MAG: 50S ribosomal protein L22 [bacterium]|nr:50S ribosomal protein L22 [bacterium]
MNIVAESRSITVSPRKVRLVADSVRKLPLAKALHALTLAQKRAARPIAKTIKSAIANAVNNNHLSEDSLKLVSVEVMEGPVMKRYHASTRGRIHPYKKQTSHIRVTLASVEKPKAVKPAQKKAEKDESEEE